MFLRIFKLRRGLLCDQLPESMTHQLFNLVAKSAKIAKDFSTTVDQHEASTEKMNHEKAELREKIMV